VARKRSDPRAPNASDTPAEPPLPPAEGPDEDEELSELDAARDAVRRAKEQLKDARREYGELRREAIGRLKQIREMSVGEVANETLKQVKRHPGPAVLVAAFLGFFLGRLFRR